MPRKPKPHGNAKYDWAEIEARYVASDITLERLCEIYGCTMSSIGHIASDRNWTQKRTEYREFIASESIEKAKTAVLFDKLQFDAMTERATDLAAALVAEKLTKEYRLFREGQRSEIEALELKEMMSVIKSAQDVKYRALNIPPPVNRIDLREIKAPSEMPEIEQQIADICEDYERIMTATGGGNGKRNGNNRKA